MSNIFFMVFIVGLTGYYLRTRLLETQSSQACGGRNQSGYCQQQLQRRDAYENGYIANHESGSSCSQAGASDGSQTCVNSGVGGVSGLHWSTCANGTVGDANCNAGGGGGGGGGGDNSTTYVAAAPTDTPIPTSTPTPTEIPTSTPTPTIVPTVPGELTPTDTLYEITPTITPTPTGILTSTPTPTIVPTVPGELTPTDTLYEITPTITPTPTITQLICATKDCNETTRPCQPGNTCIKANNGSNYCSNTSLIDACKSNPTDSACCKIVPTSNATPTEIIVAKVSVSPTAVVKLLKTGMVKSFMYLIPATIMLVGLIL